MNENKRVVERYMEAYNRLDHAQILDCLTDDVIWDIPGAFTVRGKAAFDDQIENDAFTGCPAIIVSRLIEENGVVIAEGSVRAQRRDGTFLDLAFCDVFELRDGKVARLVSYLMELRPEHSLLP